MTKAWFEQKDHRIFLFVLFIFSYLLLMCGNGIVSLTHPDEVFYIQSAKEMLAYDSWLTPMIFDAVQFEKPFLPFVLFMVAIKWFGMTAFAGRFWPSLFGIGGVLVVYWISWLLFRSKRLSFLAGVILSTSFIYLALSRAVLTDMIFAVFVAISLGFFILAYYNRRYKKRGIILCFAFAAIAILTKGLLGFCFPVMTIITFLIYKRDFSFLRCRSTWWGILLFLIIALPWHIVMYVQHGMWFLEEYFFNVHWRRILMSEHARLDNWHFYIMLMIVGVIPWFLFWISSSVCLFEQFKKKLASRDKLFFLLAWIIGVYVFVQPAHSKLASYLFPLFPAIAIILAYTINDALEKFTAGKNVKLFCGSAYAMSAFLVGGAITGIVVAGQYPTIILNMTVIYCAAGALILTAFLIAFFNIKKLYLPMVLSHVGVTVTLVVSLLFAKPFIEPWVSCKGIMEAFKKIDQSGTPILSSKFYVRGVRFYSDRPVAVIDINGGGFWSEHAIPFLNKDHQVVDFLKQRPVTWAVVKDGNVKDLQRILMNQKFQITKLDGIGGKFILKIEQTG